MRAELIFIDKLPKNSSCTFESGWCGWHPLENPQYNITWDRAHGPANVKEDTGPRTDHTYGNTSGNGRTY